MRDRCEITSTDTQKRNWSKNSDTKRNWSENSDTKRNWSKNSDTKRNWSKKSDTKRYTDIYTEKEYEKSRKIKRKIQVVTAVYSTLSGNCSFERKGKWSNLKIFCVNSVIEKENENSRPNNLEQGGERRK